MGYQQKETGGGAAVGLGNDFVQFLANGLNTGSFGTGNGMGAMSGANPFASTQGIGNILNDILSGGAGQIGGSINQMIQRDTERGAADIRARFGAGGGASFGTPAAFAEGNYRAEAAPRAGMAIGQLQLQALMPLLQLISGFASKGISQREAYLQPNALTSAIGTIAPIAGAIAPFFGGGFGGFGGNGSIPNIPNVTMPGIVDIRAPGY